MRNFRCSECAQLLARIQLVAGVVEIKCYSCNTMNEVKLYSSREKFEEFREKYNLERIKLMPHRKGE